ncbi:MAG: hypothetical protein DMG59_13800 [Acidobacteria bacterium]|nr:MAG: hypothetical protein DMG59_13800 [Acidobacteriota bacterium]
MLHAGLDDSVANLPRRVEHRGRERGLASPARPGRWLPATRPVKAAVDGVAVPVVYSGPQGTYEGLDQVNVGPLPAGLRTYSDLQLVITADGNSSNSVTLRLK